MFGRRLSWRSAVFYLVLGCSPLALAVNAVAQKPGVRKAAAKRGVAQRAVAPSNVTQRATPTYMGSDFCISCHAPSPVIATPGHFTNFATWKKHGHAWQEVHVGGMPPSDALLADMMANGFPIPVLPDGVTWDQVQDLVGSFKDTSPTRKANVLLKGGNLLEGSNGALIKPMPARCNGCHNTGFDPTGHQYGDPGIQGSWALNGIQCERCHGPGLTMAIPDKQICRDCHSSGDSKFRIPFDEAQELFVNHHPEGDEYRRSPHKSFGCTLCHDPHKSVWHDQGGVKFAIAGNDNSIGNMCTHCHTERIRGIMGAVGLRCWDCHMPETSGGGERHTHLFRINPAPQSADANWKTELNDSGKPAKFWMNFDGTTSPNGDSFLTLDLVCSKCHPTMTLQQMSTVAPFVHRNFGMIDLTINGHEAFSVVSRATPVKVNIAIRPDLKKGMLANWIVMMLGPRGWFSFNGQKWAKGQFFWLKNTPLKDVPSLDVFNGTLPPGTYTFFVGIFPRDGSQNVGAVPVQVR